MLKKNIFFDFLNGVAVIGIGLCSTSVWADVAQGDGDPNELISLQLTNKNEKNAPAVGALLDDERGETSENAVATVTADGDFLLPTYFLPGETSVVTSLEQGGTSSDVVAPSVVPVSSVDVSIPQEKVVASKPVVSVSSSTVTEVSSVAKGAPFVSVVSEVVEKKEADTTNNAVKNVPLDSVDDLNALLASVADVQTVSDVSIDSSKVVSETAVRGEITKTKPLLIPLTSKKADAQKDKTVESELPIRVRAIAPSTYADNILTALERGQSVPFHMPHEMKITFYPNASSFSGQSLKWVKAFAKTALLDPRLVVEIRVSRQNAPLQDKRLLLIQNALRGAGLSTHQINVVVTDRSEDTMLLRAVPKPRVDEIVSEEDLKKGVDKRRRITKW